MASSRAPRCPFSLPGARLRGTGPGGGVTEATVAGRKVQLVIGCAESGEYDVFISEARRLVEKEHVDAVVGGDGVVIRDVARLYPTVPFVSTFWDEQEITLRQPVANLYRFTIDAAQETAGLGGYAYHRLGWRRASIVAGDNDQGWANAAAFTAEFCALGGTIVNRVYRSALLPQAHVATDVLVGRPDGVALLLTPYDDPRETIRELLARTSRPSRQLLFAAPLIEDPTLVKSLGSRIDGIVSTSWIPATAPTQRLKSYRKRYAASFPGLPPSFANLSFVAGYADSVQGVLTAFERAGGDLSNSRNRLRAELAEVAAGAAARERAPRPEPPGDHGRAVAAPTREGREVQRGTRRRLAAGRAVVRRPPLERPTARAWQPALREGHPAPLGAALLRSL